ncbi:MAG: hypothetical protein NZM37_13075, partial [Sandaracinaceae bacterium]|nr:hypothetical protein [Sandaracinaceae bacterium]
NQQRLSVTAWEGPIEGPALRRQARLVDRVLVLVVSGTIGPRQVSQIRQRLGRGGGIGFVVLGLHPELTSLPDRCGPVEEFWSSTRQAFSEE